MLETAGNKYSEYIWVIKLQPLIVIGSIHANSVPLLNLIHKSGLFSFGATNVLLLPVDSIVRAAVLRFEYWDRMQIQHNSCIVLSQDGR